ncbi:FGGY family carbohydrate kinase [Daejeonella sp.]|uniref:xylulokinase n=1 Tax=Daejeonella sp. TaxID=2805397 RepID=UPI0025C239AD|nr:FGGY family carbohydrate kinase [Daejeonella sp.]
MLLLGIDLGTSSIKVSVIDSDTQTCICTVQYPEKETEIIAEQAGWAEQSPELWWEHVQEAILKAHALNLYNPADIQAIGIAYQMHGLVLVDKNQQVLRNSIIWCDSRAVDLGNAAFSAIGEEKCLSHLLNSPGNFTASKLAWVKQNEPHIFEKVDKIMLPGDFIAMKMTGKISTSISALSEGIFWDFKNNELSKDVFNYYGFDTSLIPEILPVFADHGSLDKSVAAKLSLNPSTIVSYKAGDQPNNALSLNVLNPGEVAANGGTSGVIYGVSNQLSYDSQSRVNTFAHVNYSSQIKRLGVLLCINGTGILNRWVKDVVAAGLSYEQMNVEAAKIPLGSSGLKILPFGNGAERMLSNQTIGAHFHQIDLNIHGQAHIFRAVQEGIAFAFRYGLDIMRDNGINISMIRAGYANMFSSELFQQAFVNSCGVPLELHSNEGSMGAAIGAGIGIKVFTTDNAFSRVKALKLVEPTQVNEYDTVYQEWKALLKQHLK